jgi:choline dehydrogenase-like flavoprotein
MARIEVDWRIDGRELGTLARFARRIRDGLQERNLARVTLDPDLDGENPAFLAKVDDSIHQMSTARIGRTADDGVVDGNLRVHGTENLYVAGAAVFPVTGFANPTFTAIALTLRLCDHLGASGRG